jgi:predicted ATPase
MIAKGLPIEAEHPRFPSALVELALALGKAGRVQEGRRLADDMLRRVESKGEGWIWSEVQRVRGELSGDPQAAEALFLSAIDVARTQGARSWALRAATSLARLRPDQAGEVLAPWVETFTEGFQTKDLIAARAMLLRSTATATS